MNGTGRNDDEYLLLGGVLSGHLYGSYFWCRGSLFWCHWIICELISFGLIVDESSKAVDKKKNFYEFFQVIQMEVICRFVLLGHTHGSYFWIGK